MRLPNNPQLLHQSHPQTANGVGARFPDGQRRGEGDGFSGVGFSSNGNPPSPAPRSPNVSFHTANFYNHSHHQSLGATPSSIGPRCSSGGPQVEQLSLYPPTGSSLASIPRLSAIPAPSSSPVSPTRQSLSTPTPPPPTPPSAAPASHHQPLLRQPPSSPVGDFSSQTRSFSSDISTAYGSDENPTNHLTPTHLANRQRSESESFSQENRLFPPPYEVYLQKNGYLFRNGSVRLQGSQIVNQYGASQRENSLHEQFLNQSLGQKPNLGSTNTFVRNGSLRHRSLPPTYRKYSLPVAPATDEEIENGHGNGGRNDNSEFQDFRDIRYGVSNPNFNSAVSNVFTPVQTRNHYANSNGIVAPDRFQYFPRGRNANVRSSSSISNHRGYSSDAEDSEESILNRYSATRKLIGSNQTIVHQEPTNGNYHNHHNSVTASDTEEENMKFLSSKTYRSMSLDRRTTTDGDNNSLKNKLSIFSNGKSITIDSNSSPTTSKIPIFTSANGNSTPGPVKRLEHQHQLPNRITDDKPQFSTPPPPRSRSNPPPATLRLNGYESEGGVTRIVANVANRRWDKKKDYFQTLKGTSSAISNGEEHESPKMKSFSEQIRILEQLTQAWDEADRFSSVTNDKRMLTNGNPDSDNTPSPRKETPYGYSNDSNGNGTQSDSPLSPEFDTDGGNGTMNGNFEGSKKFYKDSIVLSARSSRGRQQRIVRFKDESDRYFNGSSAGAAGGGSGLDGDPKSASLSTKANTISAPLAKPETIAISNKNESKNLTLPVRSMADDDDGVMSEMETEATGSMSRRQFQRNKTTTSSTRLGFGTLGLVFLQYGEETKRALLPETLTTLNDVRSLFLKAFPTALTHSYMHSPHIKIYIQDPAKQDLLYELDDLSEVKDRSVLRLKEQSSTLPRGKVGSSLVSTPSTTDYDNSPDSGLPSRPGGLPPLPPPNSSYFNEDEMNYFSEPEIDADYRIRKSTSGSYFGSKGNYGNSMHNGSPFYAPTQPNRPASALPPGASSRPQPNNFPYRGPFAGSGAGPPKPHRGRDPHYPSALLSPPTRHPPTIDKGGYTSGSEETGGFGPPPPGGYSASFDRHSFGTPSDRSSSISRSGSVTPVVDEEARSRMNAMENQLANLSSLVHSALMNKGATETMYKDIEMMRREIMGPSYSSSVRSSDIDAASDNGSVSRFSDVSSDKGSIQPEREHRLKSPPDPPPSSSGRNPASKDFFFSSVGGAETPVDFNQRELRQNVVGVKQRLGDIRGEMKHLRRLAQVNAQSSRDLIQDTFDRIRVILNTNKQLQHFSLSKRDLASIGGSSPERIYVDREQERHKAEIRRIEGDLTNFEKNVETLRQRVVTGNQRLRLSEVEDFTNSLTQIGRSSATLKAAFPSLQHSLKDVMGAEMERVVREEKFLKEEPERLDTALRRCKKLTKTMVTMKKLALVQDPIAAGMNVTDNKPRAGSAGVSPLMQNQGASPATPEGNHVPPVPPPPSGYSSMQLDADRRQQPIRAQGSPAHVGGIGPGTQSSGPHRARDGSEEIRDKTPTRSPEMNADLKNGANSKTIINSNPNGDSNVLDNLLEELQTVGSSQQRTLGLATTKQNGHPAPSKPPAERQTTNSTSGMASPPGFLEKSGFNRAELGGNSISYTDRHDRSRSNTPHSESTNHRTPHPSSTNEQSSSGKAPPPPPPPRSSSKSMHLLNSPTASPGFMPNSANYTDAELLEFKHQLRSGSVPRPIVHTNALSGEEDMGSSREEPAVVYSPEYAPSPSPKVRSASSSESVNSQESLHQPPGKPPPPPPPPRNRQELMEQRQMELMDKQKHMQQHYHKLRDMRHTNGHSEPQYPAGLSAN